MGNLDQLIARDLKHVWHPCAQMKDFEICPPLVIERAQGSYLYTNKGPLIDAISSWWCKSLGHGHPAVIGAIENQLKSFEHVIGCNTTHSNMVELAEHLSEITGKQHIYFASDGASAVEIAMKLAIHATQLKGYPHKNQFIALKNGYHGETLGTMAVSDIGLYKKPYESFSIPCHFIEVPYVSGVKDPLWQDAEAHWNTVVPQLDAVRGQVCALILEPLVQGAGGLLCYSADFLKRLAAWAKAHDIYFIADEIMTGLGRTGSWLACDHASVSPDLICLSKGLTSGSVPFSCVMVDHCVFNLFYDTHHKHHSFLHSHTYSGNPLAISAALATIQTMHEERIINKAQELGDCLLDHFSQVAQISGKLEHVRSLGAWVAADLKPVKNYRIGYEVYQQALQYGALIRPIGNTVYWLPPLNTDKEIIAKLADITLNSIMAAYNKALHNE